MPHRTLSLSPSKTIIILFIPLNKSWRSSPKRSKSHAVCDLTDVSGSAKVPSALASEKRAGLEMARQLNARRTGEDESYQTLGRSHLHCEL